jgi:hypothetical protein
MRLFLTSQAAYEKKSPPKKAGANWSLETQQNNPVPLFLSAFSLQPYELISLPA